MVSGGILFLREPIPNTKISIGEKEKHFFRKKDQRNIYLDEVELLLI
jgi:hypothetical protein